MDSLACSGIQWGIAAFLFLGSAQGRTFCLNPRLGSRIIDTSLELQLASVSVAEIEYV